MADIPEIELDFFGANLDIKVYAKEALKWAKANITPESPIYCEKINKTVFISNNGLRHTIEHKKYDKTAVFNHETIAVVQSFKEIIETCEIRYTSACNKGTDAVIYKLKSQVIIEGVVRDVELLAKELYHEESDELRLNFYNHILI